MTTNSAARGGPGPIAEAAPPADEKDEKAKNAADDDDSTSYLPSRGSEFAAADAPLDADAAAATTAAESSEEIGDTADLSQLAKKYAAADPPQSPTADAENSKQHKATAGDDDGAETKSKDQHHDKDQALGIKALLVLTAVTLAVFLMLLDVSIIATAIPRITDEFLSLNDVGWYGGAYQLAAAAMQPLTGRLFQFFNTKWTFLLFFAFFELGSLICAVANSSAMLIGGRAVAGLGSAGILNGGVLMLGATVPLHRRPLIMGIMLGFGQIGVVCGPVLGGAFTEYVSWRWCFYINLPIGGLVALLVLLISIPEETVKPPPLTVLRDLPRRLDLIGFALLAPAAIQLLLALEYGGTYHPWTSSTIIGLFCGAGATFIVFCVWDCRRGDDALLPLSIVGRRVVWSASLTQAFLFGNVITMAFFLPIYFQSVRDASPLMSGVYMLPVILAQLVFAVVGGVVVNRLGYIIPPAAFGAVLCAIGTGLLSRLTPFTSTGEWVGFQILAGAGRGLVMQMPLLAVQNGPPPEIVPVAVATVVFAQNIISAVLLVVANTIFGTSLRNELAVQAPEVSAGAVILAGATGFRKVVPEQFIPAVLVSYVNSVDRTFYLAVSTATATFAFAWGMGWRDMRKKRPAMDAEAKGGEVKGEAIAVDAEAGAKAEPKAESKA